MVYSFNRKEIFIHVPVQKVLLSGRHFLLAHHAAYRMTSILTMIVLAISFIGDGLRDAFDPRSKD